MKQVLQYFSIYCFLSLLAISANAQVKFYTRLQPAEIAQNEYATLRFVVENGTDFRDLDIPNLDDFDVVSGPNQESGEYINNGTKLQYMALSFVLRPKKLGKISLPAATANIGGKKMKSNPVSILVKRASSSGAQSAPSGRGRPAIPGFPNPFADPAPAAPDYSGNILGRDEAIEDKVAENMQLVLETNRKSVYVGESVVATYKLYSRMRSESRLTKNPSFNGFSVIDIPVNDGVIGTETKNNKEFNIFEIRKAQLYPLLPGEIKIDEAVLENHIQFLKEEAVAGRSLGGGWLERLFLDPHAVITQTVNLKSKPVILTVKPLPEAGKPESFRGAVGKFSIDALIEKTEFSTDESGMITVRVFGDGNLQMVNAPEIDWPRNFDPFEANLIDNVNTMTVPVSGSKIFEIPFSVSTPGDYKIPPITISYFDPQNEVYKTAQTDPIQIKVTAGKAIPKRFDDPVTDSTQSAKSEGIFSSLNRNYLLLIGIGSLAILGLLFLSVKKKNKKSNPPVVVPTEKETIAGEPVDKILESTAACQKNPLEKTQRCLQENGADFYSNLLQECKVFLAARLSLNTSQLSIKQITSALDAQSFENKTCVDVEKLLQDIEFHVYTPIVQEEDKQKLYDRAHEMVQDINAQYRKSNR